MRATAAAVLIVLVAGCSDGGSTDATLPTQDPSTPVTGGSALITGTIELSADCVVLAGPGDPVVLIWPTGSHVQTDPEPQVVLPDGGVVAVDGGPATFGGGMVADGGAGLDRLSPEARRCAEEAGTGDAWLVHPADASGEARTLPALAVQLGCGDQRPLPSDIFPIRGMAATGGMSCLLDGEVVHLFERAPPGDGTSSVYARREGGSVENVRRTVEAGTATPGCDVHLVIGEHWFALATSEGTLDDVAEALDGAVEPIEPATPTVSYLLSSCELFRS